MEKTLKTLEFNKIKEMLFKYNVNELTANCIDSLCFYNDDEIVNENLDKTREGYVLVNLGTFVNMAGIATLQEKIDVLSKDGILNLEEIYNVAALLDKIEELRRYKFKNQNSINQLKYTSFYIDNLIPINELKDQIKYCISPSFTIYDHASSTLKEIRRKIFNLENEIKEKLNKYLKSNAEFLQDNYITTRNNHYVLPVKASSKNSIKGIVIDASSSQNTLFIEPYFVYENNILLNQLYYDEEIEIKRIIKALCVLIYKHHEELLLNERYLKEISFMILKGSFGLDNNYEIASINDKKEINIIEGYHPLLNPKIAIKNDISLGVDNKDIMVITGPNAGGKTVLLKTVGLLAIMNQCGLPLPVKKASFPIFRNIFVDIGDDQSIEESLSGFSSSMSNIVSILDNVDDKSLVIIDELASKTDPQEGEALAKAILEYLGNKGALSLISTHFFGIKNFAASQDNIILSSMGFDNKTLAPSYKLLVNTLGRSYAFEISAKLGLNKEILAKANQYKDKDADNLDKIIDKMSLSLKETEEKLEAIRKEKEKLDNEIAEICQEKEKIKKEHDKAMQEIAEEKEEMLATAYKEINQIVASFKEKVGEDGFKHHLKNEAIDKLTKFEEIEAKEEDVESSLNIGDFVKIKDVGTTGKIIDIKQDMAVIETKNNTLKIKLNNLVKTEEIKKTKKQVIMQTRDYVSAHTPMSVNLIGMHVDEALLTLRNYIDACMMARYEQVSIIHGFGTGALRKAVHDYLNKCPYVKEYRLGGYNEGLAGATIVTFKNKK